MPVSFLKCKECGGVFPIRRKNGKLRKRGHVKTMWCPWCEKVTKHVEKF